MSVNLEQFKEKTKRTAEFEEREWGKADKDHYEQAREWNEIDWRFKAVEDGEIVGTIHFDTKAGVCYIHTLIVREDARGKGIGKLLIDKAEELAKKEGVHKIYLDTGHDWSAVSFYEKLGYEITGKLDDHYFHKDFVVLSKRLI